MAPPRKVRRVEEEGVEAQGVANNGDRAEGADEFNYGVIRFEVPEVSKLTKFVKEWSPAVYIQGIPWRVTVAKVKKEDSYEGGYLYVYTGCMVNKSQMWSVEARSEYSILHPDRSKSYHDAEFMVCNFNSERSDLGSDTLKWSELMEKGFVKNDKVTVEARVWIIKTTGIRTDEPIDLESPTEPYHGLVLDVGGEKFYVSREFLSIHSPVFKSMFYGPYDEKEKQEIPLKDVDPTEFKELLRVLYPSRYTVNDCNIVAILKLADRFQIKSILDTSEDFLIASTGIVLSMKLLLSDTYRLVHLQNHCLEKFDSPASVKKIKKTPEYKSLSDKTKAALLEKMIELTESDSDDDDDDDDSD